MTVHPYPTYKPSGIEFLDDAPKMWAHPREIIQFGITKGDLLGP